MRQFLICMFLLPASLGALLSGCSSRTIGPPMPSESFFQLDSKLKQGVSTKTDVQKLLGAPNGSGGALFPKARDVEQLLGLESPVKNIPHGIRYPKDESGHEVWLYQNMQAESDPSIQNQLAMSQKILMIFFKNQIYEGYFWYVGSGVLNVQ